MQQLQWRINSGGIATSHIIAFQIIKLEMHRNMANFVSIFLFSHDLDVSVHKCVHEQVLTKSVTTVTY